MVIRDNVFPVEIWGMILEHCDAETLCAIRLVSRVSCDIATKILFKALVIRHITKRSVERLEQTAARPHLSHALREVVYRPSIRTHREGSKAYLAEQDRILFSNSLGSALCTTLRASINIASLKLVYPPTTKRFLCSGGPIRTPGSVLQHLCSNPLPRLSALSVQGLELEDIPEVPGLGSAGGGKITTLTSIEYLDLEFRQIGLPFGNYSGGLTSPQWSSPSHRLPKLIGLMPNLTSLRVFFVHSDHRMKLTEWTALRCTRLEQVELHALQISQASLLGLLRPSIETLCDIKLQQIRLFDGTWAAVYDALLSFEAVTDISYIGGKGYLEGRGFYSEDDAASYRKLFTAVEDRRASAGLASMKSPIKRGGGVFVPDFWSMENAT